ncbi:hypothetical protein FACS1894122_03780 [Alphaproteobacteria bacterium]|nr:hypothetical protein FACS1894122_03780 [Alphaproteobacteria bacterium]
MQAFCKNIYKFIEENGYRKPFKSTKSREYIGSACITGVLLNSAHTAYSDVLIHIKTL